jgi:hypothetical protein
MILELDELNEHLAGNSNEEISSPLLCYGSYYSIMNKCQSEYQSAHKQVLSRPGTIY